MMFAIMQLASAIFKAMSAALCSALFTSAIRAVFLVGIENAQGLLQGSELVFACGHTLLVGHACVHTSWLQVQQFLNGTNEDVRLVLHAIGGLFEIFQGVVLLRCLDV